jgi:hypothetical protein
MMKKYFFAKVIKEDISDLIVKGFEVFDVSVGENQVFFL